MKVNDKNTTQYVNIICSYRWQSEFSNSLMYMLDQISYIFLVSKTEAYFESFQTPMAFLRK